MNRLLRITALAEGATGLVLLVYPPIVVRLLFGVEIVAVGLVMSRLLGIALIALGFACWPGDAKRQGLCGMLTYSALATLYLAGVGFAGRFSGVLLWPAVILHLIVTALLGRVWFNGSKSER